MSARLNGKILQPGEGLPGRIILGTEKKNPGTNRDPGRLRIVPFMAR
jgi:hypothetical protein